jgi:aryl-phospho-beta-D-glucosidase BglC (GH1 family)
MKTNILPKAPLLRTLTRSFVLLFSLTVAFVSPASADSPAMIGANIAGGDFGGSGAYPGALGTDYWYPRADDIDQAKAAGIELVRVPFTWDRVQHDVNGVLDTALWAADMTALDASITAMEARGMRIILDMHNYGARYLTIGGVRTKYSIGSPQLPASEFARAWRLIADRYKNRPSIWGYDLMNEPMGGISTADWNNHLQAAVNAIREVDTTTPIILEPVGTWAHASGWMSSGYQLLSITDSANNLIYSAHCYTDRGQEGVWKYGASVTAELVGSGKPYSTLAAALNVGVDRVKPFVDWCVANNVRGLVGEYASPSMTDQANWDIVTDNLLAYMKNNGNGLISGTQWSHGGITQSSETRMQARKDNSQPSLPQTVLPNYVSGVGTNYWPGFTLYKDAITATADYSFAYSYPAAVTINAANTAGSYSGNSIKVSYNLASGVSGGGGLHIRGPLTAGAIGGVDISQAVQAGHVLSFYAKASVAGASVSVTLGKTTNASGVDSGGDTGTGSWVGLNGISPLTTSWQRYQIPLSSLLSANVNGTERIQRFRFIVGPSDGVARDIYFDQITIGVVSTNTAPTVTVNTSTGGSTFTTGATVSLVSTATDSNPGDSIDYVEFYANGSKVGIDDTSPYQANVVFTAAGTYAVTAIAYDTHGISKQSTVKTLTLTVAAPAAPTGLAAITGDTRAILNWTAVSGATGYNVKRATTSGGPYTTVGSPTATTWTDTGLTNGTTYYYVVSSLNGAAESVNSAQANMTPQAITLTIDNVDATRTGTWYAITTSPGYYGTDYLHDGNNGATGGRSVRFTPTITTAGYYEVYARWVAGTNRPTNTPMDVNSATGTATTPVNQKLNNNTWYSLGIHFFNTGTTGNATIRNDGANGTVIADAMQFVLR